MILDESRGVALVRSVRAQVQKQLEEARVAGKIGSSLQAEVEIRASGAKLALLQSLQDDLRAVAATPAEGRTEVQKYLAEKFTATPYNADDHGLADDVRTYFANCVARSAVDPTKKVPSYSRPVRIRRLVSPPPPPPE